MNKNTVIFDNKKRLVIIIDLLKKAYPNAKCELNFSNELELAIAAILSAQCVDKRVNEITKVLFNKYHTVLDWSAIDQETLEKEIKSAGFYKNKARNIRSLAKELIAHYNGKLPEDLEELIKLPGIGRKTANVLLINAFHKPGITVDTHCKRVSIRLKLVDTTDPDKIELELKALLDTKDWTAWSHCSIFHGRYCCIARSPKCSICPIKDYCPSAYCFD